MDFTTPIPFAGLLGIQLHRFMGGEAEMSLELREDLTNSWGVAHGGVTMTLLDVVMAHAARSAHSKEPDHGPGVVTVEMKTSFMRPAEGRLAAKGVLLHRSTTMAFCEASVFNEEHQLCAHATGTFKYLRKLPTQGRATKDLQQRS